MTTLKDYQSDAENQWCSGCPNFGILQALKKALVELGKEPHEVCFLPGIGQAAKLPHYLRCNFFNGLHGRAIPIAVGIQAVNPGLTTIVTTGEGDAYGEGGNHFLHALRRNPDITVVVHNNEIYALTKGQGSPTTVLGEKRKIQFKGVEISRLNMLATAVIHNCSFVARGFAGDIEHLSALLVDAVRHRGLSYVDVVQPCITWNPHPLKWYKDKVYKLGGDYDPGDMGAALQKSEEWDEKIPIGVLYRASPRRVFGTRFREGVTDRALSEFKPIAREKMEDLLRVYRRL